MGQSSSPKDSEVKFETLVPSLRGSHVGQLVTLKLRNAHNHYLVEGKTRMQHGFGERIDLLLQRSVRAASRLVKERQKQAREKGMHQEPPSFEEFSTLVNDLMENGKRTDLDRLRNLS